MSYSNLIKNLNKLSLNNIIEVSYNSLSEYKKRFPWRGLNHGVRLLETQEELSQYLCAYGKMHKAKIDLALQSIKEPQHIFNKDTTVIDWGCGQALATLCFFDYLSENCIDNYTKNVILIDPSEVAISRARIHVEAYNRDINIKCINKYIDDVYPLDINTEDPITIHFFSNILDINGIDLKKLSCIINDNIKGKHYFCCVSPLNYGSDRIREFASMLNIDNEEIIKQYEGSLQHTRGTIKLLTFSIGNNIKEIIKTDFYPVNAKKSDYVFLIDKILQNKEINSNINEKIKNIILFYQTIVELERAKEPSKFEENIYDFPMCIKDSSYSINLENNVDFIKLFDKNACERFPSDLFIDIEIKVEDKTYTFLSFIIAYYDLRKIDNIKNNLVVNLSDFTVNDSSEVYYDLGLDDEKISEIEECLKLNPTIEKLDLFLKESDIFYDEIKIIYNFRIGFCQKNVALSQIESELKKIHKYGIAKNSLLFNLLHRIPINNILDRNLIKAEDLIYVSEINESQKLAVLNSLNNRLSVITGPPGSGKTQVILNILANAILQNKKVLVASKLNKAIDNIKERFDKIDRINYLIRFGSKQVCNNETIPSIERLENYMRSLNNHKTTLKELLAERLNLITTIASNEEKILKRDQLYELDKLFNVEIKDIEIELSTLRINHENNKISLRDSFEYIDVVDSFDEIKLNNYIKELKAEVYLILKQNKGINRLFFNFSRKKKWANHILLKISSYPTEVKTYLDEIIEKRNAAEFCSEDILKLYNNTSNVFCKCIEYIDTLKRINHNFEKEKNSLSSALEEKRRDLDKNFNTISEINNIELSLPQDKNKLKLLEKDILKKAIEDNLLNKDVARNLCNYRLNIPNKAYREEDLSCFSYITKKYLEVAKINTITSLSVKSSFPLDKELFDMVVVDEASQCDIASALPLIFRTKQLVIIGDPLQLKHISRIEEVEETYIKQELLLEGAKYSHIKYNKRSLWDFCKDMLTFADANNVPILLDKHYRCHPDIIRYSNEMFYIKELKQNLTICTKDSDYKYSPKGVVWLDVIGRQKEDTENINELEAQESINLAMKIAYNYPELSIGIITSFKDQSEYIYNNLNEMLREKIAVSTVHSFQGDERDIIIYSLVVTDNSPKRKIDWIDKNINLVNVAVTRAKNTLYIVGNKEYIIKNSPSYRALGNLARR